MLPGCTVRKCLTFAELSDSVNALAHSRPLGPRGGGYETRLTSYSNLEPTAGRRIADAAIELAKAFKPGAIPTPPLVPLQKSAGWSYGNVPPELD